MLSRLTVTLNTDRRTEGLVKDGEHLHEALAGMDRHRGRQRGPGGNGSFSSAMCTLFTAFNYLAPLPSAKHPATLVCFACGHTFRWRK
jgi:hypothetical protein